MSRTKHAQLEVLAVLARVPCLLEHPEVKPYQTMVEGYGLGFDLPHGGTGENGKRLLAHLFHYPPHEESRA